MGNLVRLDEILRSHNLKVTRSRIEVLKILQSSHKPLSHSEIMEKLDRSHSWDRVTIYRTLGEFIEKKIVKPVLSLDRATYFELLDSQSEHAHISCLECGKMECLEQDEYKFILEKSRGFEVRSTEILIKGICKECK